jgi:hypothetical protein
MIGYRQVVAQINDLGGKAVIGKNDPLKDAGKNSVRVRKSMA